MLAYDRFSLESEFANAVCNLPLNLYLLTQSHCSGYDTYDSCVVAATDSDSARLISPSGIDKVTTAYSPWPGLDCLDKINVQLIGTAAADVTKGSVLCSSFNAG